MNPEKTDEYNDVGLGVCVYRKSVSVTNNLIDQVALPVSIVIIIVGTLFILSLAANSMLSFVQESMTNLGTFIVTINPLVLIAIVAILSIPVYSTFWCLRHRRRMKERKSMEESPVCPIEETEKKV